MNERIIKLQEFVKYKHEKQVRKYTGEPYYNHVFNVAHIAKGCVEFGEDNLQMILPFKKCSTKFP